MDKPFKPMRAESAGSITDLPYPLLASPKIDGIRCVTRPDAGALSNTLRPIPNEHIRAMLAAEGLRDLDGEITAGDPTAFDAFSVSTSAIMTKKGKPAFTFHVFDDLSDPSQGFSDRLQQLRGRDLPPFVRIVEQRLVTCPADLEAFEAECLSAGYEGVMLRRPDAAYKFGRSTLAEAGLLKLKRFVDFEAEVIGVEELHRNANAATVNALGYTERSISREGLLAAGILGALVCRAPSFDLPFNVGSGFSDAQRAELWSSRDGLVGKLVKVKYQPCGTKDRPRLPVFLGFRHIDDVA
ncbi:DNA ligase-1 [Azospirillum agricola]|uniref:ATP-dependent DNA ligase n=1 Tax=Azospirillum agricola TaxID=1720247 RepID=UPI001AEABA29|nr:ATP-dependent DNA ligase [Azospirillum agricola]MBP2232536.1 DNA ligase-1 [Azospirillum agricola]